MRTVLLRDGCKDAWLYGEANGIQQRTERSLLYGWLTELFIADKFFYYGVVYDFLDNEVLRLFVDEQPVGYGILGCLFEITVSEL